MTRFVLASRSPRRRELMRLLGYPFQSIAADVDESSITHADPAVNVMQTAQLKAAAIATRLVNEPDHNRIIIAADTTVTLDGQMLGKPSDEADAWRMLRALRNRRHHVHTGITLINMATDREISGVSTAVVTMRNYTDDEIIAYVASGDPMDKAGAYAIQHPLFRPVAHLEGCYTGVMGLSVCHLIQALRQLKLPVNADSTAVHAAHHQYPCPIYNNIFEI